MKKGLISLKRTCDTSGHSLIPLRVFLVDFMLRCQNKWDRKQINETLNQMMEKLWERERVGLCGIITLLQTAIKTYFNLFNPRAPGDGGGRGTHGFIQLWWSLTSVSFVLIPRWFTESLCLQRNTQLILGMLFLSRNPRKTNLKDSCHRSREVYACELVLWPGLFVIKQLLSIAFRG